LSGTLAAGITVEQEWDGTEMSAAIWCPEEAAHMKLWEFKHSYSARDRILTLLLLESAEPRSWDRSWQDEDGVDSHDQFNISERRPHNTCAADGSAVATAEITSRQDR
jgi:hypothetical protein